MTVRKLYSRLGIEVPNDFADLEVICYENYSDSELATYLKSRKYLMEDLLQIRSDIHQAGRFGLDKFIFLSLITEENGFITLKLNLNL